MSNHKEREMGDGKDEDTHAALVGGVLGVIRENDEAFAESASPAESEVDREVAQARGCLDAFLSDMRSLLLDPSEAADRFKTFYRLSSRLLAILDAERQARAEAERELIEVSGIIGNPGTVALSDAGLSESLSDRVRYTHRQWLEQMQSSNQRVLEAESKSDRAEANLSALRERCAEAERARSEAANQVSELRAALIDADERYHSLEQSIRDEQEEPTDA